MSDSFTQAMGEFAERLPPELLKPDANVSVEQYLAVCEALRRGARTGVTGEGLDHIEPGGQSREASKRDAAETWGRLRQARIFTLPAAAWVFAYRLADWYTTEHVAGFEWTAPPPRGRQPPQEEVDATLERIRKAGKHMSFPHPMPFEVCYLAFGKGMGLSQYQLSLRLAGKRELVPKIKRSWILGLLLSEPDHLAVEMVQVEMYDGYSFVLSNTSCAHGRWVEPFDLTAWVSKTLIELINEHRVFTQESMPTTDLRYKFRKSAKKQKVKVFPPKPYYVVNLQSKTITEMQRRYRKLPSKYAYQYRFDVRGHERVKVRRGALPIPEKEERKLRQRGYHIYKHRDLLPQDEERLRERGIPKKGRNEWMAILVSWVDSFKKGPKDKPYIPAVRKVKKVS